jgi:hypothetical protein
MVSGRARTLVVATVFALAACQGRAVTRPGSSGAGAAGRAPAGSGGTSAEGGEGNATGGTSGVTTAGSAGQGVGGQAGAGQGVAGAGAPGDGGSSGATGSAGGGWSTTIPHPSDREKEILAPLGTDDATIDGATGSDLTALANSVGLARGYAMCRCTFTPNMPPQDGFVEDCATAETGTYFLSTPDGVRCIEEEMAKEPGVVEYVRCVSKWTRDDGRLWQEQCVDPGAAHVGPPWTCAPSPEVTALVEGCSSAHYCADGTRGAGHRCDQVFQCADESDELGCFDVNGRDWFWCDGELVTPFDVCRYGRCGIEKVPPVCAEGQPDVYLCNDGGTVTVGKVCDRAFDCGDGSDERYCVK